jgi:DNA (cytosine-5)-methyltransferase 1
MENVKGLTFEKHGPYLSRILTAVRQLGYRYEWRVLNSADYGVPQTRERFFLIARLDGGPIVWPTVTHTKEPGLFTERWVSMADVLGWGMDARPFGTVASARTTGGPDIEGLGGSGARATLYQERDEGRWVARKLMGAGMVERHGDRPVRTADEPAFTVRAQGGNRDIGGFVWAVDTHTLNGVIDADAQPAPTFAPGNDVKSWVWERPATTIAGDVRVFQPGGHHQPGEQSQNAIPVTIPELARLQDFPDGYRFCGTKTDQARQIGNAVPPTMARILAAANRPLEATSIPAA